MKYKATLIIIAIIAAGYWCYKHFCKDTEEGKEEKQVTKTPAKGKTETEIPEVVNNLPQLNIDEIFEYVKNHACIAWKNTVTDEYRLIVKIDDASKQFSISKRDFEYLEEISPDNVIFSYA